MLYQKPANKSSDVTVFESSGTYMPMYVYVYVFMQHFFVSTGTNIQKWFNTPQWKYSIIAAFLIMQSFHNFPLFFTLFINKYSFLLLLYYIFSEYT